MTDQPPKISASDLINRLAAGDTLAIFDVRKTPAFNASAGILPGATWKDYERIAEALDVPIDTEIIVYCVHGHEVSQTAASLLQTKGHKVRYLEGGYESYLEAGGPIVQKEISSNPAKAS